MAETIKITRALLALKQRSKGLSGVALAAKLGVNQPFMSKVLAGKRLPGRGLSGRAEFEYGVPISWWDEAVVDTPEARAAVENEITEWFEKRQGEPSGGAPAPEPFRGDRVA